ncbi:MAG TPA: RNA polymerase sigma factor [Acidimicrobiia bacterium]|nr:RNA polymerase sigma factor [Acidimicrobiia bacterium]
MPDPVGWTARGGTRGLYVALGERFDEVVEAAKQGEEWAFEALYRDLAPTVLGYLRGRGSREPEDRAADVFMAVARGVDNFRGDESAFRSWVFSIAHRRLIDERRRAGRRPEEPFGLVPAGDTALRPPAEDQALDRLSTQEMLRLMDGLTDDQRDVVLLRLVADLPVAEVARIMGRREGAIKTLQRRALARLAGIVAGETGQSGQIGRPDPTKPVS